MDGSENTCEICGVTCQKIRFHRIRLISGVNSLNRKISMSSLTSCRFTNLFYPYGWGEGRRQ